MIVPDFSLTFDAYEVFHAHQFAAEGARDADGNIDTRRVEAARRVLAVLLERPLPPDEMVAACRSAVVSRTGFNEREARIAEYVLAACVPSIVPGRGWIVAADKHGNTREAFVELATPSSAPQVLATVGVESHRNAQVLALRVKGEFVEEFPWDVPQGWDRARTRAEELVGIAEREAASASPTN